MDSELREQILADIRRNVIQHAYRMIWVTFQREGIHKYPAALTDSNLATGDEYDVSFLAYPHRHIFHFNVGIQVHHNDRDLEFIQVKRWIENLYSAGSLDLDYRSCEMMAEELYDKIASKYPYRDIEITVSEDGENGATLKFLQHST